MSKEGRDIVSPETDIQTPSKYYIYIHTLPNYSITLWYERR
jgi:hypothetical protein